MVNWILSYLNYFFIIGENISAYMPVELKTINLFVAALIILAIILHIANSTSEPRNIDFSIKLTKSELEMIKFGANKLGMSESEFIVRSVRRMSKGWDEKK